MHGKFNFSAMKTLVWRTAAALLAVTFVTSHLTSGVLAKYTDVTSGSTGARVAKFSYSAKINDVSALSFTNTDFWGGTGDVVPMNALRSLDFTVKNSDENGSVSEVSMEYELEFIAPQNFVNKLAFQLFDGEKQTLLPQIVVNDFLTTNGTLDTSSSRDYNSEPATDRIFTVSETNGVRTAVSEDIIIKFEPLVKDITHTLSFRLWDVSALNQANVEEEGGELAPPLVIDFLAKSVLCYKISISMPQFVFPLGTDAQTHKYGIRLAPTSELADEHLRGELLESTQSGTAELKSVYKGQTLATKLKNGSVSTFTATKVSRVEDGKTTPTYYENAGNAFELFGENANGDIIQKFYTAECYSKNYPLSVKVYFEQIN